MRLESKRLSVIALALSVAILAARSAWADGDLLQGAKKSYAAQVKGQPLKWQAKPPSADGSVPVQVRFQFKVGSLSAYAALQMTGSGILAGTLNGKPIPVPLEGMRYSTIPAIPTTSLRRGANELIIFPEKRYKTVDKKRVTVWKTLDKVKLVGQKPDALAFQTGPVLGAAGSDFFTVTCRTNMIAAVTLQVEGRTVASKPGVLHSLRVERLKASTAYTYRLAAKLPGHRAQKTVGPFTVRTFPARGKLVFAALGDSRSNPRVWKQVAEATLRAKPMFAVFTGDMVGSGRIDRQWDDDFFGPAPEFFATLPLYAVVGNHEQNAPLCDRIFATPWGKRNWSQRIGPVLLVGVDGTRDWRPESKRAKWLEQILADSDAKFIFLANHYPAWTTGMHGKLKEGKPKERQIDQAQTVIMPMLEKHGAAAFLAGHDHNYERSEPPGGVSVIVCGGAGAPLRDQAKDGAKQNPHSKIYAKVFHFCLFTIEGDTCSMQTFDLQGKVIDTRTWKARQRP